MRIDPALASLVPPGAVVLAGVRMDAVRKTGVWQKLALPRGEEALERFRRQTGLDPRQDLWELLAVSDGRDALVMARGKFTPTGGLEPRIEIPNARRVPYKGLMLIGSEDASVVFTNSSTAVAGPAAALRAWIDHRGGFTGIPEALAARLKAVPPASQIWAVASAPPPLPVPLSGNLANIRKIFDSIRGGWLAVDLSAGLDAEARGECSSEPEARRLHDALRGLLGLGRLSTPDNQPDLLRAYDRVEVALEGAEVKVAARLPLELVEKLVNALPPGSLPRGSSIPLPR